MNDTWRQNLPNLIIAGVRKGGTTSLSQYLAQHPEICSFKLKKVGYFLPAKYDKPLEPLETYADCYKHCGNERYRIEAVPGYFLGVPTIPELIQSTLGDVRIIISLREPVDTLWSYYRWVRSHNRIDPKLTFEQYTALSKQMMATGADLDRDANAFLGFRSGHYAEPLEHWCHIFGNHLLTIDFQELARDPANTIAKICRWLAIDDKVAATFDYDVHNKSVQVRNSKLQSVALEFNRRAKVFFRRHRTIKRRLRSAYYLINRDRKDELSISPEFYRRLQNEFTDSNVQLVRVLRRHDIPIPGWLNDSEAGALSRSPQALEFITPDTLSSTTIISEVLS